jgi:hypothetical protein
MTDAVHVSPGTPAVQHLGVEKGEKVWTDCMVIESNVHHPNDSSLLGDRVRVCTWLMKRSNETFGLTFKSHRLRGKRRVLDISNAKSMKERTPLYRDLLKITRETVKAAEQIAARLDRVECETVKAAIAAQAIAAEIRHFLTASVASAGLPVSTMTSVTSADAPVVRQTLCPYSVTRLAFVMMLVGGSRS